MNSTHNAIGTCNPDGTLKEFGTTAPKAPGHRNDPIVVGKKYILASGAHTGGTAIPEATCLAVNGSNALMQSNGLYSAAWPGSGELDISSYMGGLSIAVSDAYAPRKNGGGAGPDSTIATGVSVYNGTAWTDDYSNVLIDILSGAALTSVYGPIDDGYVWLGTEYTSERGHVIKKNKTFEYALKTKRMPICPTFILDLTRVQISGAYISLANPEGQVDAHNVTYGDSDVDTALMELNNNKQDKPDYDNVLTTLVGVASYTPSVDCYVMFTSLSNSALVLKLDGVEKSVTTSTGAISGTTIYMSTFVGIAEKGTVISTNGGHTTIYGLK